MFGWFSKHVSQLSSERTLSERVGGGLATFKDYCQRHMPIPYEVLGLLGSYIFAVGILDWFMQRMFMHDASDLYLQWTIGFRPEEVIYNGSFITYLVAVVGIVGGLLGRQLLNYIPALKRLCITINEHLWGKVFGLSLLMMLIAPFQLTRFCFFVVTVMLGLRMFAQGLPEFKRLTSGPIKRRVALFLVFMCMIAFSFYQAAKAWYPVLLTNDYIEVADSIQVPATQPPVFLPRTEAIHCLTAQENNLSKELTGKTGTISHEKIASPKNTEEQIAYLSKQLSSRIDHIAALQTDTQQAPAPCSYDLNQYQSDLMVAPLVQTGSWQSQAGRLLYHHSYLYVPAAHLLTHGLASPIPYLYGLGNTWFHSMLLKGQALTLTTYFNTFPIAQLTGILVIMLCVFYMNRSVWTIAAGFAATLIPLWGLGYESIQLAPGFSPLRYAGLAMQMASIFYIYRKQSAYRLIGVVLTLAFSTIWNKEYAVLGFVGQLLAMMAPQLRIGLFARFAAITVSGATLLGLLVWLGTLSAGFLETIQVGIFGIAMPTVGNGEFLLMCLYVLIAAWIMVGATLRFEAGSRMARLCVIPVLCLLMIKYVYNTSPNHLFYTLSFICPMTLVFFDWHNRTTGWITTTFTIGQRKRVGSFMISVMMVACVIGAMHYQRDSVERRNVLVNPFQKNSWTDLGEQFVTTTPAAPIVSRIKAVQDEIKPQDAVLFLSPFDHLMSFYGNPASFCGHFEYLTNLVTYGNVASVEACVKNNPNALVVYDDAVEEKCPQDWAEPFYDAGSCTLKKKLLLTLQILMNDVKPQLVLVKKVGPLSFYRHAEKVQPAPLPTKIKKSSR